ncbi:MAG: Hcp family type VI secretion system effector [Desulfobacterota bacterium]|nr:Hcp family type VI secretion system effector [Thermodesulfobacteriota bacterium]
MPMPFHMSIKGTTQGEISKGCCEIQGREDTILCQALKHEVYIPRDPQTGLPTGKRVHNPITVTKVFDKASPLLYEGLTRGERMTDVTMKFYRINPQGQEEHYFTIKLEDAIIVSIKPWIPNALDPTQEKFTHMEDVSFTYSKINWRWEIDGVEGQDDWKAPEKK